MAIAELTHAQRLLFGQVILNGGAPSRWTKVWHAVCQTPKGFDLSPVAIDHAPNVGRAGHTQSLADIDHCTHRMKWSGAVI